VRQAIIMLEERVNRITVLNEPGTQIPPAVWADYRDTVRARLAGERLLVCMGSLPPGAPPNGYGQLVELARAAGAISVVDCAPGTLAASLAHGPDLVTPNLEEAEAALAGDIGDVLHASDVLHGGDEDIPERAARAARELCARGARRAAVTAGSRGVAFADGTTDGTSDGTANGTSDGASEGLEVHWVPAVPVDVVSAVGAGDSFVAGLALELIGLETLSTVHPPTTEQWLDALYRATATAAASCEQVRAGGVDPARVAELLELVRVAARGSASTTADATAGATAGEHTREQGHEQGRPQTREPAR